MNGRIIKIFSPLLCILMLCSCSPAYEYYTPPSYDTTDYTRESAGIRLEDDFYGYVNFDFLWNNNIPADMAEYSSGEIVQYNIDKQLTDEITEIADSKENYPVGSDEQKIKDLYLMYLDTDARENTGTAPLMKGLMEVENCENINDFVTACGLLYREYGCDVLCYPYIAPDIYDSSTYTVYLEQMDLLYPAEDLLNTADSAENMQKVIAAILEVYGSETEDAYDIVSMILDIAKSTSDIQTMDITEAYNSCNPQELQEIFDNVDVLSMLEEFGVGNVEQIVIYDMAQAEKINTYLTDEYLSIWKSYAICRLLYSYSDYLPEQYSEMLNTQNSYKSEQERAVIIVKKALAWEVGNIYAEKYCDRETIDAVTELTESVKAAYCNVITDTEQLSEEARDRLLLKLECMKLNIGCPEEDYYSNCVVSGSLLESGISIKSAEVSANLDLYGTEVKRGTWDMTPQTVNAYYDVRNNSITITAALFNEPYYYKDGDLYTNLGGLGTVIAHEMTHAFDGQGIQFDEKGCYNPEWTGEEDGVRIDDMKRTAADYFGNQTIMNVYGIDGSFTVDENIADAGALHVIASMTDERDELQRIFENYAVIWATLSYDTDAVSRLSDDVHSPAEIRVNAVLSATDKFYSAYDITEDDKMYVAPDKRLRIW